MPRTSKSRSKRAITHVPYARGFHPPSEKRCQEALSRRGGKGALNEELGKEYEAGTGFFPPIPKPTSIDDWLAQYNETGQTFKQFLEECPWLSRRKLKYVRHTFNPSGETLMEKYPNGKIYLLPLGDFDGDTTPTFADLAEYSRLFYDLPVEVLPPVQLLVDRDQVSWVDTVEAKDLARNPRATRQSGRTTHYKLSARFHSKSGRYQLQVGSVLYKLRQIIPNDSICVMALTMSELYDESTDLFVAGMAAGNQRVGVFSFSRYDPTVTFSTEFWYQVYTADVRLSSKEQKKVLLQRSCKLLVHEIAHLLGVDHCIWYSCCMNGSGHLTEDFDQSMHLCPVDLRKLQTLCGFNVVERYEKLSEFFKRHGLEEEEAWTGKRLRFITSS